VLLLACLGLVALVTALLNLDTSAVFLTPVLIKTARRRGVDVVPFLYGSVFMANASSLFLPGSNLTNLLVLSGRHVSGGEFFTRMLPGALAASALTAAGLLLIHRRRLFGGAGAAREAVQEPAAPLHVGAGLWGTLLAAVLIVTLTNAALPVLGIGVLLAGWRARGGLLAVREAVTSIGAPVLVGLFGLSVALGTLARGSAFPADTLHSAGAAQTATVAALASVLVNNLPAAVLLSSTTHLHPNALLLGLNLGPNLAVTGSLAVLLWWRAALASGIRPSVIAYSRQGLALAPLALAGALALGSG
jgi:arsenical pump membrane protein